MKPRTLIMTGLLEAALLLGAVYFEPTYNVRGWVHGEAFYDGNSTSWWRQELDRWDVHRHQFAGRRMRFADDPADESFLIMTYSRQSTWFESHWQRWAPAKERDDKPLQWYFSGPRLLHGDKNAIPVLQALLDDPSPKVRMFARIGLGMDPTPEGKD